MARFKILGKWVVNWGAPGWTARLHKKFHGRFCHERQV